MARKATGSAIEWIGGMAQARVRVAGKRETFRFPTCKSDTDASDRRAQLVELAARMTAAGTARELCVEALRRVAAAPTGTKLNVACVIVDKLIGGWRPTETTTCITFGELARQWISGELHARFPKKIKARKNMGPAIANLKRYAFPTLENVPVDAVTLEACDAIAAQLGHLRDNSTRQVLAPLCTLLRYAAHPLKLIPRSPIPEGWQPKEGDTRELQWLYPSEDAKLMACTKVPLWVRVYFGYLIREGGRPGEPVQQSIEQFDFEHGTASLRGVQTKTKKARMWQLEAGTARALQRWLELRGVRAPSFRRTPAAGDYMFVNGEGRRINPKTIKLPELLRASLQTAGITRSELFEEREGARRICAHDPRRSFVTVKLALGKSEGWISDRTGHLTSTELRGYQKAARTFAELAVGDFLPLDVAIPELRCATISDAVGNGQVMTGRSANHAESLAAPLSIVEPHPPAQAPEMIQNPMVSHHAGSTLPAISGGAGQSAAERIAALEAQLALALRLLNTRGPDDSNGSAAPLAAE